jgi:hypothetical protein
MYLTQCDWVLGCSLKTISGMIPPPSIESLKKAIGGGATICVTAGQIGAEKRLKEAGYICLADYPNHAHGHAGNRCKLWAAFKKPARIVPGYDEENRKLKRQLAAAKKREKIAKDKLNAIRALFSEK